MGRGGGQEFALQVGPAGTWGQEPRTANAGKCPGGHSGLEREGGSGPVLGTLSASNGWEDFVQETGKSRKLQKKEPREGRTQRPALEVESRF